MIYVNHVYRPKAGAGVVGVLQTGLQMIENGDSYVGVATDHVIESFRNRLWAGYKTGGPIMHLRPHALPVMMSSNFLPESVEGGREVSEPG
jgi:hypothetical protein